MAVDGNWNITLSTPMGERKTTLTLLNSGGTLTGTQGADGQSTEIFDGAVSGDTVNWKVSITNPMPLTLEFIGKRQHVRRSGYWPDGQLSLHRDAGLSRSRGGLRPDLHRQAIRIARRHPFRDTACDVARSYRDSTGVKDVVDLGPGADARIIQPVVDVPDPLPPQ
jgi:hypothetical protein